MKYMFMTALTSLIVTTSGYAEAPAHLSNPPPSKDTNWTFDNTIELKDGTEVSRLEVLGALGLLVRMHRQYPTVFQEVIARAHGNEDFKKEAESKEPFVYHLAKFGILNTDGTFAPHAKEIIVTYTRLGGQAEMLPFEGFRKKGQSEEDDSDN